MNIFFIYYKIFYEHGIRTVFIVRFIGDVKFVYQFLQKLTSVDRFEITLMFLSAKEKQGTIRVNTSSIIHSETSV